MSTVPTPSQVMPGEVVYPDRDDEPMAETTLHAVLLMTLVTMLREHFAGRSDVFVIGNIFWYYEEGNPAARRSPDVMVVKGIDLKHDSERNSFKTWEEGAVPCVIVELTSASTAAEDREAKYSIYERNGVREYFLFDPYHEYLERPLLGYRLIGGRYEALRPAADGSLPSAELGLRLRPEGMALSLVDPRTGQRLPTPPEAYRAAQEARRQAETEGRAREEAERRTEGERRERQVAEQRAAEERFQVETERAAREAAERRAEQLTAELARLRALLPPGPPA